MASVDSALSVPNFSPCCQQLQTAVGMQSLQHRLSAPAARAPAANRPIFRSLGVRCRGDNFPRLRVPHQAHVAVVIWVAQLPVTAASLVQLHLQKMHYRGQRRRMNVEERKIRGSAMCHN